MKRKKKYFEVYLDPRLKLILEACLKNNEVKKMLISEKLKEDASGVAKLAIYQFLRDKGKLPRLRRRSYSTNVE